MPHQIPRRLTGLGLLPNPTGRILCVVIGISQLKPRNNSPAPKIKLKIALIM